MPYAELARSASAWAQHLCSLCTQREAGLYCKLSKCKFAAREVQFLGHVISQQGVKPNPVKVQILQDWPVPRTMKELRGFLGLALYFAKFIPGYAIMTTCLQALLRKNAA